MTYEKYPNPETNGNPQDQPLFILTKQMLRAIQDGPLLPSMIDNVIQSVILESQWREHWYPILADEEKEHLHHVQTTLPKKYNSPLQTLLIMYCFG
ncbi:MAG: hypothetical protein HRU15_21025 [Planctomycetes bacterium]|nr:hypothetical protein [Planctomycetota bacterium]